MRQVKPLRKVESPQRILRKRRLHKLMPRHPWRLAGIALALAGIGLVYLAATSSNGRESRLQTAFYVVSGKLGLSLRVVDVVGRHMTGKDEVLKALSVAEGMPILAASPERARQQLETLPWIKSASVERQLPDRILVTLNERQPLALWQRSGKMVLIDTEGVVVLTEHLERYGELLLVVGEDAPKYTAALLEVLHAQPDLAKRVVSAVRVEDRRWNLRLDNGIDVELPEGQMAAAWNHLAEIDRDHALLAREIKSVDLRLPDRVVVREAVEPAPVKPASGGKPAKSADAKSGEKTT